MVCPPAFSGVDKTDGEEVTVDVGCVTAVEGGGQWEFLEADFRLTLSLCW